MPFRRLALVRTSVNRSSGKAYSDDAYVMGVHHSDEVVFTALVDAFLGPLTQFAFGCLGDEDLAHDVVQDNFARVWRSWSRTNKGCWRLVSRQMPKLR